jgi:hypothetical protein
LLELIKNSSDKSIVDTLSHNLIYTEFNIGENIQTVPSFIEMRTKDFVIKDVFINENIDEWCDSALAEHKREIEERDKEFQARREADERALYEKLKKKYEV